MKPTLPGPGEDSPSPGSPVSEEASEAAGDPDQAGEGKASGDISAFIPKEVAMGRTYKPGETISMVVKAVDPDTGEMEVQCAPSSTHAKGTEAPSVAGLDTVGMEE